MKKLLLVLLIMTSTTYAKPQAARGLNPSPKAETPQKQKEASEWKQKTDWWWGWQVRRNLKTGEIQQKSIYGSKWRSGKDGDLAFEEYRSGLAAMGSYQPAPVPVSTYKPTPITKPTTYKPLEAQSTPVRSYTSSTTTPVYVDRRTGNEIDQSRYAIRRTEGGSVVAIPRYSQEKPIDLLETKKR